MRGSRLGRRRPRRSSEGTRVAALQLTQMDVPHTVISDTAVGWLLSSRRLDAALLRGDTVAANGDTLALIGSLNVATLATAAEVPVFVIAPTTSLTSAPPTPAAWSWTCDRPPRASRLRTQTGSRDRRFRRSTQPDR